MNDTECFWLDFIELMKWLFYDRQSVNVSCVIFFFFFKPQQVASKCLENLNEMLYLIFRILSH